MTRERAPYSRVYWSVLDDAKFDAVRSDMRHFGSWCLMLVLADMSYPSPAFVPPTVPRRSLTALADSGLIDLLAGSRYRIHGLDAERTRRSDLARDAVRHRYERGTAVPAPYIEPGTTGVLGRGRDEAKDEAHATRATDDPVVAYAELAGGYPSPKAMDWIDGLTEEYGHAAVIKALAQGRKGGSTGIIGRARDILRAEARALSVSEKEVEKAQVHLHRLDGMHARRVEWFRNTGKWEDGWGPRPEEAA